MNRAFMMMTVSELLRHDAEVGNELDHFPPGVPDADPKTWEAHWLRRRSLLTRRREIRDELNARHCRDEN